MTALRTTLRTADDLVETGLLAPGQRAMAARIEKRYAVAITPAMAGLIDRADPADPIARQFVPDARELDTHPAELADPIGDHAKSPVKGIVHRYRDRVLLKIVGICPVYCRFCFRREMVGPDSAANLSREDIAAALDYISAHVEIREVILTGGDPFMLSPRRVRDINAAIGTIPHVTAVRWHTRVPVVAPERMTRDFVAALTATDRTVRVALHTNHPRELTDAARAAIASLSAAGADLLSQSVLLRGINDEADTLEALLRALIGLGVKPYYLHHGDLAPGTAHFRTTIAEGRALMAELRRRLPDHTLPAYVLDVPGAYGKVALEGPAVTAGREAGLYEVRTASGADIAYREACVPRA